MEDLIQSETQYGERLSFFDLFGKKQFRICIPIIQRDYAQGRETTAEVRINFLNALYDYLEEDKPFRDLDFIYGSLIQDDNGTSFVPLDGQQRLTTLFLLHWYLYQISEDEEMNVKFISAMRKEGKSMFSYETRSSSSEFCDALINSTINSDKLLGSDLDEKGLPIGNQLSKTIKNCSWFYLSWKQDPTIQSMLTMLDAIHGMFYGKQSFFDKLLDEESPVITFLFLNLKDFQLTDDLYIKMNSRGKPLTSFENFKAKYEQSLGEIDVSSRVFHLQFGNEKKEVSLKKYFSYNIDTKWADLFWNYRFLQKKNDGTFDKELGNFIRVFFASQYAMNADLQPYGKDDKIEYLLGTQNARKKRGYSDEISYHKYRDLEVVYDKDKEENLLKISEYSKEELDKLKKQAADCALFVIDALDCFSNGNTKIAHRVSSDYVFYFDEDKAFENALKYDFENNHQRLCFHAYTRYLILNNGDFSGIDEWMRVVHNLTHPENKVIDETNEVVAGIKAIEKLLPYSNSILKYFSEDPDVPFFSTWQVLEEKVKAHLILKGKHWKDEIEQIEKHRYFNGQIGFMLEFAGIIDYYKRHHNCSWNDHDETRYFNAFVGYSQKSSLVFANSYDDRVDQTKDFAFERAVLTKGDYLVTASWPRKNLLSTNVVKNNIKRDLSWKRFLRFSDDAFSTERRGLVKQVFDDARFDTADVWNSLENICNDANDDWTWRSYFVICPDLIRYCNQGFIRFEDAEHILLYSESQTNHYHVEMYTYYMWLTYIYPNQSDFLPFKTIQYYAVKSIEEDPCICFDSFVYKNSNYYLEVIYYNEHYQLSFKKHGLSPIHEEITKVLNKCGFTCTMYSAKAQCEFDEDLIPFLKSFVDQLQKL